MKSAFCNRLPVQGLVQSGFLWGYMATQMIGGSLADKYGGMLPVTVVV